MNVLFNIALMLFVGSQLINPISTLISVIISFTQKLFNLTIMLIALGVRIGSVFLVVRFPRFEFLFSPIRKSNQIEFKFYKPNQSLILIWFGSV